MPIEKRFVDDCCFWDFEPIVASGPPYTDYDFLMGPTYLEILEMVEIGLPWPTIYARVFLLDPSKDPIAAKAQIESHIARAQWCYSREGILAQFDAVAARQNGSAPLSADEKESLVALCVRTRITH